MAHELAHNLGINDHVNNLNYLMFATVCQGCRCFHPDSVQILRMEMSRDYEDIEKNVLQIEPTIVRTSIDLNSFGFLIIALGAAMVLLLTGWIICRYRKKDKRNKEEEEEE